MNRKYTVAVCLILTISIVICALLFFMKKHTNLAETSSLKIIELNQIKKQSHLLYPSKICIAEKFFNEPAVFISDRGNNRIVVIRLDGSIIQTVGSLAPGFSDGNFNTAQFHGPQGMLWEEKTNTLYVADTKNHAIRKIDFTNNSVLTIAGTGIKGHHHVSTQDKPTKTALASPSDIAFFPNETTITIAQAGTHQLWVYEINKKRFRILAGNGKEGIKDGELPYNSLAHPAGIATAQEELYFVDKNSNSMRKFKNRKIETICGKINLDTKISNVNYSKDQLNNPEGIAIDQAGVYIADTGNNVIRYFDLETKKLSIIIGNGVQGTNLGSFGNTNLNNPNGLLLYDKKLWIADTNNHRIVIADLKNKICLELEITPQK